MEPDAIRPDATQALRQAHGRLCQWKERVVDLMQQVDSRRPAGDSSPDPVAAAQPFFQELQDCCERAENEVLRMAQLETAWRRARADVEKSLASLEKAWSSVEQRLRISFVGRSS